MANLNASLHVEDHVGPRNYSHMVAELAPPTDAGDDADHQAASRQEEPTLAHVMDELKEI